MGWPFAWIRSDHPWSCLRNHIFSLFCLIDCRFSSNSYILKAFGYKILLGSLEFLRVYLHQNWEYLLMLLAAVVEVTVRTVTLPNLLFFWCCTLFVGFVQIVVALALIEGWQLYLSLWLRIMKIELFSYDLSSRTCFAVALQLWLRNMLFNKLLHMGSYDFVTVDKFGKNGWSLFWPHVFVFFWLFLD